MLRSPAGHLSPRRQHSSSFSSKLGMPFDTLNRRPVSGQISAPSTSCTCVSTMHRWRAAGSRNSRAAHLQQLQQQSV